MKTSSNKVGLFLLAAIVTIMFYLNNAHLGNF